MKKMPASARICLIFMSLGVVSGAAALTGDKAAPKLEYHLDAGWPKLPNGMKLGGISAVASDSKGNIYLLHRLKPHILVFGSDGTFLRSWSGDFKTPHGLRIDKEGHLWIADMANHLVQKFKPDGTLLLKLGQKDKPGLGADQFNKPADVAVGKDGEIYVADGYGNSRIAQFAKDGKFLRDWGKKGKGAGEFNIPHVVVFDDQDRVVVGDRENSRVQIFDRTGKLLSQWTDTGAPYGLYLHQDRVYLADGRTGTIRVLDKTGKLLSRWDSGNAKVAPHWISVDAQGAIYVGFVSGSKIERWTLKS
ncbi:MAG TPA: peptidyl-alpha-hydroxyglycine alpha-amidating lyase family protein [Gemmataceae bacterium]|nr:peptidyl-alpha-hydroxyglycine alpha-amidating lyase family protein [Gemmataceae bacterium]